MNIPLRNRLQKRAQRDVALLEDVLVRILYEADSTAEIHGGTAIWRCYGGRRFSKDIDIYLASQEKLQELKERIRVVADRYNAKVEKLKDTGHLIYISFLLDDIYSEIDINYKAYYREPVVRQYENLDGSFYDVLTLPPEALIDEKINAYADRESITDLYDIGILLDHADVKALRPKMKKFVSSLKTPARLKEEESRLQGLIYEGPIPSFRTLVDRIKGKIS